MKLNLIETLKTSIYNPNTPKHVNTSNLSSISKTIFSKSSSSKFQRFMLMFIALGPTQPSLTSDSCSSRVKPS